MLTIPQSISSGELRGSFSVQSFSSMSLYTPFPQGKMWAAWNRRPGICVKCLLSPQWNRAQLSPALWHQSVNLVLASLLAGSHPVIWECWRLWMLPDIKERCERQKWNQERHFSLFPEVKSTEGILKYLPSPHFHADLWVLPDPGSSTTVGWTHYQPLTRAWCWAGQEPTASINFELQIQTLLVQIMALPCSSCVTLGMLSKVSKIWFPHL